MGKGFRGPSVPASELETENSHLLRIRVWVSGTLFGTEEGQGLSWRRDRAALGEEAPGVLWPPDEQLRTVPGKICSYLP